MTPEEGIKRLPELTADVRRFASILADEAGTIADDWDGLGRVGGRRSDHAACLLGRLRPILRDLAGLCQRCETQIDAIIRDPFAE